WTATERLLRAAGSGPLPISGFRQAYQAVIGIPRDAAAERARRPQFETPRSSASIVDVLGERSGTGPRMLFLAGKLAVLIAVPESYSRHAVQAASEWRFLQAARTSSVLTRSS